MRADCREKVERSTDIGMKRLRRALLWYILLQKRLFKKCSFLVILCIVPLLAGGMKLVAAQEKGVLKIVLCAEDGETSEAGQIQKQLMEEEGIVRFFEAETRREAENAVQSGTADAAWIFAENFSENLRDCAAGKWQGEVPVIVVEREDNVALQLAREKLIGAVYPDMSYEIFRQFVQENLFQGDISEQEMRQAYEVSRVEGDLFQMSFLDGTGRKTEQTDYLVTPLRGLLSLTVLLCGLAGAMYYRQDEASGMFSWMPGGRSLLFAYGYHLSATMDAAAAVLVALWFSGCFTSLGRELLLMVCYVLAATGFCLVVGRLCGSLERLAAGTPVLILMMFVLCPIFLDIHRLRGIQCLFPPFYYLNAVYHQNFFWYSFIYIVVIHVLTVISFSYSNRNA